MTFEDIETAIIAAYAVVITAGVVYGFFAFANFLGALSSL